MVHQRVAPPRSIWRVSESFPELAQVITELAQPCRIDIVRAKKHVLGQLCDGQPHSSQALIASVASLLGAGPLGHPEIDPPGRESVKAVVTAEHPVAAAIRADVAAREALAELAADGLLIAAGQAALPGTPALTLTYHLPSSSAGVVIGVHRPAVLPEVVRLPHRLRQQGLWGIEPDMFIADLGPLGLDPRTERSLREAIESYRRGVFLAAASQLGAAVEGRMVCGRPAPAVRSARGGQARRRRPHGAAAGRSHRCPARQPARQPEVGSRLSQPDRPPHARYPHGIARTIGDGESLRV
jgi:hypothetical protein